MFKAKGSHPKQPGIESTGKPHGAVTKSTALAREAIASFVDGNSSRIQQWLEEIYEADGPKAALESFEKLLEYHVPKLSRVEHKGEIATEIKITWDDG